MPGQHFARVEIARERVPVASARISQTSLEGETLVGLQHVTDGNIYAIPPTSGGMKRIYTQHGYLPIAVGILIGGCLVAHGKFTPRQKAWRCTCAPHTLYLRHEWQSADGTRHSRIIQGHQQGIQPARCGHLPGPACHYRIYIRLRHREIGGIYINPLSEAALSARRREICLGGRNGIFASGFVGKPYSILICLFGLHRNRR